MAVRGALKSSESSPKQAPLPWGEGRGGEGRGGEGRGGEGRGGEGRGGEGRGGEGRGGRGREGGFQGCLGGSGWGIGCVGVRLGLEVEVSLRGHVFVPGICLRKPIQKPNHVTLGATAKQDVQSSRGVCQNRGCEHPQCVCVLVYTHIYVENLDVENIYSIYMYLAILKKRICTLLCAWYSLMIPEGVFLPFLQLLDQKRGRPGRPM